MGLLGAMAGLGKGLSMVAEDNLKTIQRNEETVASEDRQRRVAEWQAKMSEEYAIAREERAVQRKRGEEAELASATDKAETRSAEIGTDRRFQKFMEDGKQAGYFEGMSPEEIKGVFEQTYDDKRVNAQEGGDRYQDKTLAVKADDFVKASRESGNAGLLTQALNDRKTAIGQDNTNAANAFKERQEARKDAEARSNREIDLARIDATQRSAAAAENRKQLVEYRKSLESRIEAAEKTMPKPPKLDGVAGGIREKAEAKYKQELEAWKSSDDGRAYVKSRTELDSLPSPFAVEKPRERSDSSPSGTTVIKTPEGSVKAPADLVSAAKSAGIKPEFILGLARLETQLGSKNVGDFNAFNIKDFSGREGSKSAVDRMEGSRSAYRSYESYDDAVADLVGLLQRKYPAALEAKTPEEFARALKDGGYATDPNYVSKLTKVISGISVPDNQGRGSMGNEGQQRVMALPGGRQIEVDPSGKPVPLAEKPVLTAEKPVEKMAAKPATQNRTGYGNEQLLGMLDYALQPHGRKLTMKPPERSIYGRQ